MSEARGITAGVGTTGSAVTSLVIAYRCLLAGEGDGDPALGAVLLDTEPLNTPGTQLPRSGLAAVDGGRPHPGAQVHLVFPEAQVRESLQADLSRHLRPHVTTGMLGRAAGNGAGGSPGKGRAALKHARAEVQHALEAELRQVEGQVPDPRTGRAPHRRHAVVASLVGGTGGGTALPLARWLGDLRPADTTPIDLWLLAAGLATSHDNRVSHGAVTCAVLQETEAYASGCFAAAEQDGPDEPKRVVHQPPFDAVFVLGPRHGDGQGGTAALETYADQMAVAAWVRALLLETAVGTQVLQRLPDLAQRTQGFDQFGRPRCLSSVGAFTVFYPDGLARHAAGTYLVRQSLERLTAEPGAEEVSQRVQQFIEESGLHDGLGEDADGLHARLLAGSGSPEEPHLLHEIDHLFQAAPTGRDVHRALSALESARLHAADRAVEACAARAPALLNEARAALDAFLNAVRTTDGAGCEAVVARAFARVLDRLAAGYPGRAAAQRQAAEEAGRDGRTVATRLRGRRGWGVLARLFPRRLHAAGLATCRDAFHRQAAAEALAAASDAAAGVVRQLRADFEARTRTAEALCEQLRQAKAEAGSAFDAFTGASRSFWTGGHGAVVGFEWTDHQRLEASVIRLLGGQGEAAQRVAREVRRLTARPDYRAGKMDAAFAPALARALAAQLPRRSVAEVLQEEAGERLGAFIEECLRNSFELLPVDEGRYRETSGLSAVRRCVVALPGGAASPLAAMVRQAAADVDLVQLDGASCVVFLQLRLGIPLHCLADLKELQATLRDAARSQGRATFYADATHLLLPDPLPITRPDDPRIDRFLATAWAAGALRPGRAGGLTYLPERGDPIRFADVGALRAAVAARHPGGGPTAQTLLFEAAGRLAALVKERGTAVAEASLADVPAWIAHEAVEGLCRDLAEIQRYLRPSGAARDGAALNADSPGDDGRHPVPFGLDGASLDLAGPEV